MGVATINFEGLIVPRQLQMTVRPSGRRSSLQDLFSTFCCPRCRQASLDWGPLLSDQVPREATVICSGCQRVYSWREDILDFKGGAEGSEVITPFQRLMQFPPITAIYEKYWRPLGFFIASSSSFRGFTEKLMELMNPARQQLILDLACGPGLFTCPMAEKSPGWVIGFDLSLPMLRRARRKAHALGLTNVLFVRGSAFHLPFQKGVFDAILCSGALHLLDTPQMALTEIARTLSAQGRLVCQTTLKPKHFAGLALFLDRVVRFGFFESRRELNEKLRSAGIMIDEEWSRRIVYLFRAHLLQCASSSSQITLR
jgi:ubiquinone/menaquinone biosynthesis C-methylase UbiE